MEYSVVIPCAGVGSRMELGYNKMLYQMDNQKTVIENTVAIFMHDEQCKEIILVPNKEDYRMMKTMFSNDKIKFAKGGATRQESVYHGLLEVTNDYVLIHDGARCYLKQKYINDLLQCLKQYDACLLMVEVKDTIKQMEDGFIKKTIPRNTLMAAQTPQAFKTSLIVKAYRMASEEGMNATDDSSLVEYYELAQVKAVSGDYQNIKITTIEDIKSILKE